MQYIKAAHNAEVRCLKLTRDCAGLVLASGADDFLVKLWDFENVGKELQVIQGHHSAVQCVSFGPSGETVISGAAGGEIMLSDVQQGQSMRRMEGNNSSCCMCVNFHPFGEFIASGTADASLKMWDMRTRACIHTYRGHNAAVCRAAFSPDGRLLLSGSTDGAVKVWDLTAGRLVHEWVHRSAVTAIEYHPAEYVVATASAIGTVLVYDLEQLQLITSLELQDQELRALAFSEDGATLCCASSQGAEMWTWEAEQQPCSQPFAWSGIADVCMRSHQLLGCSFQGCSIGTWDIDLAEPVAAQKNCASDSISAVREKRRAEESRRRPHSIAQSAGPDAIIADGLVTVTTNTSVMGSKTSSQLQQCLSLPADQTPSASRSFTQPSCSLMTHAGTSRSGIDPRVASLARSSVQGSIDGRTQQLQPTVGAVETAKRIPRVGKDVSTSDTDYSDTRRSSSQDAEQPVRVCQDKELEESFLSVLLSSHGVFMDKMSGRQGCLQRQGS